MSDLIRSRINMSTHRDKASLYVDTQELFRILYDAQFEIPKRDRPVLATRVLDHSEKICAYFALSYHTEEKLKYTDLFIAEFEALKICLRMMMRPDFPIIRKESICNQIRDYLAKIDESVVKWRKYVSDNRQEGRPKMAPSDLKK